MTYRLSPLVLNALLPADPCGYERPWFGHGKLGVTCAQLPKPRTAGFDGRKASDLLTIDSQLAGPADAV